MALPSALSRTRHFALLAAVACAACASPVASGTGTGTGNEDLGLTRSAIIAGTPSDASQDAAVMLVYSDPATRALDVCTAALIAPRLVLTARHCVADTDADVACSAAGDPVHGGVVHAKHDANKMFVFTGPNRPVLDPKKWKPAGQGMEIIDDGSPNLCNHDIALVLLAAPITTAPLAALRLDGSAEQDEKLLTIGWGVTEKEDEPAVRQQRSGVTVTRVGPDDTAPVLTPNEFTFDESICLGDSGGPILDQGTNGIVGVVSRGGNGQNSDTNLALGCLKPTNLGTKIAPFKDLLDSAFTKAGAQPIVEIRPASPPSDSGCALRPHRPPRGWPANLSPLAALVVFTLVGLARRRRNDIGLHPK